jgi:hypothetical protein
MSESFSSPEAQGKAEREIAEFRRYRQLSRCYEEKPFGELKSKTGIDRELHAHLSRVALNHAAREMAKCVAAKYIAGEQHRFCSSDLRFFREGDRMATRTGFGTQDSGFRVRMSSVALGLLCLLLCLPFAARHSSVLLAQVPAGTPVHNGNAKSVTDRGGQVYNALGYPGSDIGAQVNAAIAASPATGGIVFIPAGSYTYGTPIVVNKPLWLTGSGAYSTRLTYTGSGDAIQVTGLSLAPYRNGGIRGIYLTTGIAPGHPGPSSAANGIHQIDSIGFAYEDVSVVGFTAAAASGFLFDNHSLFNERIYMKDVTVDTCTYHIRYLRTGGSNSFEYGTMRNVHLDLYAGEIGMFLDGSGGYVSVWTGEYQINTNISDVSSPATFIKITGDHSGYPSEFARNTISIFGEQTYGSGAILANIDATSDFDNIGVINLDGVTTKIIARGGWFLVGPPGPAMAGTSVYTNAYNFGLVNIEVGQNPAAVNKIGSYLMPRYEAADSYRMGLGLGAFFNGTNWISAGDGANNGALLYLNDGIYAIPSTGGQDQSISDANLSNYKVATFSRTGLVLPTSLHCYSSASPAECNAAPVGSVVIAPSATSVVVHTSAVTANGQILLAADSSLGVPLGVTCNTQSLLLLGVPKVTARVAGTSFTVGIEVGPTTNPMCLSFSIIN